MYEVLIKAGFNSAHNLRGYKGKCENLHGHSWKVEARFEKETLNKIGISADFNALKTKLKNVLEGLDHTYLNEVSAFKNENPSAENIARFIYMELKRAVKEKGLFLKDVSVWESESSCASYSE